jgi:hypothetical protein
VIVNIKPKHTVWGLCLLLLALALALIPTAAQEESPPLLTLTSPEPAHPVQFQRIAPGDVPIAAAFASHLDISEDQAESLWNIIYIAVNNTGWSEGVVGLVSEVLHPEGQYVALEVDADGEPIEGGLAFDLVYDEDLGETGGFTLHVLISRTRRFGIFPAGVEDGQSFPAMANIREMDGAISRIPVRPRLEEDPMSVFAPLILEFHIVARAIPTAVPEVEEAAESSGGWGACGSCDSCGHTGECVLSPEGACLWDARKCGAPTGNVGASGVEGGYVCIDYTSCDAGGTCQDLHECYFTTNPDDPCSDPKYGGPCGGGGSGGHQN